MESLFKENIKHIKIDVVPWFSGFPWNLAGGYYSWLTKLSANGVYSDLNSYNSYNSDIIFLIGPHYTSKFIDSKKINDFVYKIKSNKIKLVLIEYESIFNCDYSSDYIYKGLHFDEVADKNSKEHNINNNWKTLISNADLLIVHDPRDSFVINNKMFDSKYYPKTMHLPFCVDTDLFVESKDIENKCCLYASKNGDRARIMEELKNDKNFDIHNITYSWDMSYADKKNDIKEYVLLVNRYLINLNTKSMAAGIQNRVYETMAFNRIALSHKPTNIPGREGLYKTLNNVVWYDNEEQITDICIDIIENQYKYKHILENARNEILQSYTHEHNI